MNEPTENEIMYIDERDLMKLKAGIVFYGLVGILFVIAPLILSIFTSKSLSGWTILISIILAVKCCYDQVWGRIEILSELTILTDDDFENNIGAK